MFIPPQMLIQLLLCLDWFNTRSILTRISASLPAHLELVRASSPHVGVSRSQMGRRSPAPLHGGWQTEQTAGTWSTSSPHRSLMPPTVPTQKSYTADTVVLHTRKVRKANLPLQFRTSRRRESGCGRCGSACSAGSDKRWRWGRENCGLGRCSGHLSFRWSNHSTSGPKTFQFKHLPVLEMVKGLYWLIINRILVEAMIMWQ